MLNEENNYIVDQIDDMSWRIDDKGARIFLFAGSERALVVDSGYGSGDLRSIISSYTNLPVMLVNTHADYDHVGGNRQFEIAYMHPSEFARYHKAEGEELAVSPLWEGDIIDLGGRSFEIILIPGHTPGSIALLDAENRVLLGGDSILDDIIAMCDYWRDFDAYINSLQKLSSMRNRFDIVYPSHGSFPIGGDIIDGLIDGAVRCKNGKVEGVDTDFIENMKMYNVGIAKFVF
ncbi:MAG: MBL fold metallo-hydrolase [Oscillospiraceae bacterium]|nr:MBL fold metallo-hydrolase [Oscillospiraceae bacterium]